MIGPIEVLISTCGLAAKELLTPATSANASAVDASERGRMEIPVIGNAALHWTLPRAALSGAIGETFSGARAPGRCASHRLPGRAAAAFSCSAAHGPICSAAER